MKKITFILFALITGTAFAQTTVSTAAEIIEAITLTENAGLNFGKIDNTAGIVDITPGGVVTGKTQVAGGTTSSAQLTVSGAPDEAYTITVPGTSSLAGPSSATLSVTGIVHNSTQTLDASGNETVNIGGTLNVETDQIAGSYTGTISVTVSYN